LHTGLFNKHEKAPPLETGTTFTSRRHVLMWSHWIAWRLATDPAGESLFKCKFWASWRKMLVTTALEDRKWIRR